MNIGINNKEMKIGILTFHWAINYGAVLQSCALQSFLTDKGHEVEIINYIPFSFKYNLSYFIANPKRLYYIKDVLRNVKKNRVLEIFRNNYLHRSAETNTYLDLCGIVGKYDVLISGSDQVLNPSFAEFGEGKPTPTYFLKFDVPAKKIGYAVSFGCVVYPDSIKELAQKWVGYFDKVGARERTGISILESLNYSHLCGVVPDPLILYGNELLKRICIKRVIESNYSSAYILRNTDVPVPGGWVVIDDYTPYKMEEWISIIAFSSHFITNSFHGMLIAILFHVPFAVYLEKGEQAGMNDRFYTTLDYLGLKDRIVNDISHPIFKNINWEVVDSKLKEFALVGEDFLAL